MHAERLKNALLGVTDKVYHNEAPAGETRYIVWAEAGQGKDAWADGRLAAQALRYSVTLYTPEEYDAAFDAIQSALNAADISFYLAGAEYLPEPKLTFFTWICEVEHGAA